MFVSLISVGRRIVIDFILSLQQIGISKKAAMWLKEGTECKVSIWNDKVIQIQVPTSMTLKVTETEPGVKGNTAQGVTKPATLETGAVVTVPGFISEGEMIIVNTEKKEYTGRGK